MKVTVLGMGNMGRAIAGRLVDHDHEVVVWNRSAGKAAELVGRGATEERDLVTAVGASEAAILSLRDDAAARQVLEVLPSSDGRPVVNCSTSGPEATRALAALVDGYVAAPILGAPAAVADGSAAYLVAGPPESVQRIRPLLDALTDRVVSCGADPGQAALVKVVNNALLLTGLVALSEAVAVGQAAGLDDDFLQLFLSANPLVAPGLANRLDDIISGDHDGWFAMPLGAKDLDLFVDVGTGAGADPVLARRAADRYREAAAAGLADIDVAGVVELLRRRP